MPSLLPSGDRTRFPFHPLSTGSLTPPPSMFFDYRVPTGFRLAVKHPERITTIISQNGNAYEEGLSEGLESDPRLLEGFDPGREVVLLHAVLE